MQSQDSLSGAADAAALNRPASVTKGINVGADMAGFSHSAYTNNVPNGTYGDRHARRANVPAINTNAFSQAATQGISELTSPGAGFDMNFTPLLPSQLLLGSPFQPGTPSTFASPQFTSIGGFAATANAHPQNQQGNIGSPKVTQNPMSPQLYTSLGSPDGFGTSQLISPTSPLGAFPALGNQLFAGPTSSVGMAPGILSSTSRTVYLGNIPPETPAEEILSHVRSGQIESVRLLPDKNCAFISFLDGSSATHFHSDAILKKLCIKGNDIKVGWGKPSSVPTSVALAVQQSGASRNVYLGNLADDVTEAELREDLGKFGPIDTVKIVREKAIAFVHFLSISNAIKAVAQLPQEPKWQPPRRVYYGKDRCAYVSKTQQQNAAQYLGIAPGYAHVLNGADRDLISNALAQQSVAAAAVATTAGGVNNLGNRTVYLGNIHPETTIEEICNVVRGGLLHHIRYIPDKHICFVTFIDPTSAASFYALSNLQGLMIHNRRLKIGWGKHSGALPPAIALAVSGGASRNVYVGNLDEAWTEERLRQDFSEYGEIELVNTLREKSCAFVNFTNIANAIKAIEGMRSKEEYKRFKINFGKDRCGNPPRQMNNQSMQQQQQQVGSPINGFVPNGSNSPVRTSMSPPPGANGQRSQFPIGPTPSAILNAGANNPLTMYLNQIQQQQVQQAQQEFEQQQQQHAHEAFSGNALQQQQTSQFLGNQQNMLYGNGTDMSNGSAYDNSRSQQKSSGTTLSSLNELSSGATTVGGLLAPTNNNLSAARGQHARAVSLPVFTQEPGNQTLQLPRQSHHQHQQSSISGLSSAFAGLGNGGFGLAIQNESTLPGWVEEELRAQ